MSTTPGAVDDVLALWAVQRLAAVSVRMRVRTFIAIYVVVVASGTAVAATAAFLATTAAPFLLEVDGADATNLAWSTTLVVTGGLAYLEAGALLRERFSRVRFTVPAAQVRGLWLALDLPLRHVVTVERGAEHLPRLLLGVGIIAGTTAGLATAGQAWPAVATAAALGVIMAGALGCYLLALHNATGRLGRRAPAGLWETYLVLLGLTLGATAPTVARWSGDVTAAGLTLDPMVAASAAALLATLGWMAVGVLAPRVLRTRRSHTDVPLLGFDAPAVVADRLTLWPRRARATAPAAIAAGSGALTVHPMVLVVFRCALTAVAAGIGLLITHEPLLRGTTLGALAVDEAVLRAAPLGTAMLASVVCIVPVIAAGHEQRLWHYRTLWELGVRPATMWAAHVTGSLVQTMALAILVVAGIATLTGEVPVTLLAVAAAVVLAEHLSESALAHPSRGDGDRRGVSYAPALLAAALVAPAILAGIGGGWWARSAFLYVLLLALGGLWCFKHRLTSMPLAPE